MKIWTKNSFNDKTRYVQSNKFMPVQRILLQRCDVGDMLETRSVKNKFQAINLLFFISGHLGVLKLLVTLPCIKNLIYIILVHRFSPPGTCKPINPDTPEHVACLNIQEIFTTCCQYAFVDRQSCTFIKHGNFRES